jgi:hypothetical protein
MTTLTAVRWKHPLWTIRRSACKSGCCKMFEAEQAEGSSERVVYCHTLGELDIRLDHLDRKGPDRLQGCGGPVQAPRGRGSRGTPRTSGRRV